MGNGDIPTFVKWAGGKTQLLEQFKPYFPKKIDRYLEPFLGSGALFFYIMKTYNPREVILSDNNPELINCYIVVKENVKQLIKLLKKHEQCHSEEYYYQVRESDPINLTNAELAAKFLYLNKTCYNGLYRVNRKGKFNVPYGRYRKPNIVNKVNLLKASRYLQSATIKRQDFVEVLRNSKNGDFIYLDPPYYPISSTSSFTSYTKDVFLDDEQKRLSKVFRKLDKKGCKVMLSNSDSEFIKNLYADYRIEAVHARRAISCKGNGRGAIFEILVLNYGEV